jgi:hypothetical protein
VLLAGDIAPPNEKSYPLFKYVAIRREILVGRVLIPCAAASVI